MLLIVAGTIVVSCASHSALLSPTPRDLAWTAPDSFQVVFETSRGPFTITAHRAWSPLGVDRLHFLVRHGFYDGARFFRIVPGFVVQWGIAGNPALSAVWSDRNLPDEPVRQSNLRGRVSYARSGPNTRSVQLYINIGNNPRLDTTSTFGFPPIGEVSAGLTTVDSMYAEYSCRRGSVGTCPSQDSLEAKGNAYVERVYPRLDYIKKARVVREWRN
ncbi:MAG TPA: peptidylprolyl isomerase [Gemmatimonadales bacterium]|nr:peptidylprolyl isomerase [Gemmatimonadales bacterium]